MTELLPFEFLIMLLHIQISKDYLLGGPADAGVQLWIDAAEK